MQPRLLIIINRFVIGGQAADTIPLLYRLKDKYQVKIIYGHKEADEIEPLFLLEQYPGLNIEKLPSLRRSVNPFTDVVALFKLHRLIKNYKPHIVHTHGAKSGLLGRVAASAWGKAAIVHTFHGHLFHSYFNTITTKIIIHIEKSLAKITHAAIALSPSQKIELIEKYKIFPSHKVFEVPLGMAEPEQNLIPKQDIRSLYKIKDEEVTVAIIGRIVPIKNHLDFINIACDILKSGTTKVTFLIIGDGNDRTLLQTTLTERGYEFSQPGDIKLNSKFIFTSWISDMYSVMNDIDIVVLTSSNEGTPVSLIEAQLCGKSIVAYNVGGVKDTFQNDKSGFLIDKGDTKAFANRLIQLIEDKELRNEMGNCGKAFAQNKFSKDTEVAAIEKLYSQLLKTKMES